MLGLCKAIISATDSTGNTAAEVERQLRIVPTVALNTKDIDVSEIIP
jgi:hypothetical protein